MSNSKTAHAQKVSAQENSTYDPDTLDLFGDAPVKPSKKQSQKADNGKDIMRVKSDDIAPVKQAKDVEEPRSSRRKGPRKSRQAFKTISEVASKVGVPQHVLRFWETKFSQIKPMKRGGGRRYYRPDDVQMIERIHQLLYHDGYTIKGVQRLLKITSKTDFLEGDIQAVQTVIVEKEAGSDAAKSNTVSVQSTKAETQTTTTISKDQEKTLVGILRDLRAMRRELNADID